MPKATATVSKDGEVDGNYIDIREEVGLLKK